MHAVKFVNYWFIGRPKGIGVDVVVEHGSSFSAHRALKVALHLVFHILDHIFNLFFCEVNAPIDRTIDWLYLYQILFIQLKTVFINFSIDILF